MQTDGPQRLALLVPLQHPPGILHPHPMAIAVAHSIFGGIGLGFTA